jgi:hypothetical protein
MVHWVLMTGVLFINGVFTFYITGIQVDGLFMFSLARSVDSCVRPYGLNPMVRYACHHTLCVVGGIQAVSIMVRPWIGHVTIA